MISNYKELLFWQRAHQVILLVIKLCKNLPKDGISVILINQIIRAAGSVGANIAEGYGRYHYKDRIKFYYNARGSLSESKHWGLFSYERGKINKAKFYSLLNKQQALHKKLNSYISSCYNYNQQQ